jgi:hypothetical protein
MRSPPSFFEPIRQQAAKRWDQLEADPELAGPWRQLFRQVQSPRHVLSELLQNADDAGAHSVWVRLDDDDFTFRFRSRTQMPTCLRDCFRRWTSRRDLRC